METPDRQSILEIFLRRAERQPDVVALYVEDAASDASPPRYKAVNFRELREQARVVSDQLRRLLGPQSDAADAFPERVLIANSPGIGFVSSFFGCLEAGAIAVPIQPSRGGAKRDERWESVESDCHPAACCTDEGIFPVDNATGRANSGGGVAPSDPIAFLQYTSGSTGEPKGVAVSYNNLGSNLEQIRQRFGHDDKSVGVIWLPPYHDMGLIGGILQPIYAGFPVVLIPPLRVIQNPYRWLKAISDFRATTSGGPNFAYEHALLRIPAEKRRSLDLSSWSAAFVGAEIVRKQTLTRFAEGFAESGFTAESFLPCYGLAESTLMVSGERGGGAASSADVSCGPVVEGHELRIVDPNTREACPEREVGEIWVCGPSVAAGYWGRQELSQETFRAGLGDGDVRFLRTGDLGYLDGDELFVCGRQKDLIIVRGQNCFPADLERVIEEAPGIASDVTAAIGVDTGAEEEVAILQEVRRPESTPELLHEREATIRGRVSERFGLAIAEVVFVKAGSLPRTKSGKLRRVACQEQYVAAALPRWERGSRETLPVRESVGAETPSGDLEAWLITRLASKLRVDRVEIDLDRPFVELGVDSVAAVELSHELSERLGLKEPLDATFAWRYPTIRAVVNWSCALVAAEDCGEAAALPITTSARSSVNSRQADNPIAIVGMSCRFPGRANSPRQFWRLLETCVDATSEIPRDRWDVDAYYDPDPEAPGKIYTRRGAFIDGVADFDAERFGVSPREAASIDPQQRLLLEGSYLALRDAGFDLAAVRGSNTAVYVGLGQDDYAQRFLTASDPRGVHQHSALGTMRGLAAGRISYLLGLHGPAMQVDTTCSSSLVATHLACQALRTGETDLAIAGGASLMLAPQAMIACCKLKALSPDGRCHAFDGRADGYVRGEGCGVLLLQRMEDAVKQGLSIYAVLRGSAVNHDGQTNGLTAPSSDSQARVIRQALQNAGVSPEEIEYVETHGTGTPLGDPIELQALGAVFADRDTNLTIGSVKSSIGHLEAAAGVAGLLKAVLAMRQGHVPRQLHCEQPTDRFAWSSRLMVVEAAGAPWPTSDRPRLSGVSSFGMSGTNAHVVIERPLHPLVRRPWDDSSAESEVVDDLSRQTLWAPALGSVAPISLRKEKTVRRLSVGTPGSLDGVRLSEESLRPLAEKEVEILVSHAGVNFRDVLITMGLYPEPAEIGCECVGVVAAVGSGVDDLRVGDRVMALGSGCFADRVITSRNLVTPAGSIEFLPAEQIAALPVAYATAAYALQSLADLKPGQCVLIHTATGGLGQAALQVARRVGARVFATASRGKWPLLKRLGVENPMDSRSLEFAEQVLRQTDDRGVDMVLSGLVGEARQKSLESLAPGGRFLEIGKGDGVTPEEIAKMRPDVQHHTIDLGRLCAEEPAVVQGVLHEIVDRVGRGEWRPPQTTVFDREDYLSPLRSMQRGEHTGKLIIRWESAEAPDALNVAGFSDKPEPSRASGRTVSRAELEEYVCGRVSQVLGYRPDQLDREKGFFELGLDSLTAIELKNSIQREYQIDLPSTIVFDYPNTNTMIDYLAGVIRASDEAPNVQDQLDRKLDEVESLLAN